VNEKQAKRLRWLERDYVRRKKKEMGPGPQADDVARALGNEVRRKFSYLTHRERGLLMRRILVGGLEAVPPLVELLSA
jgi:hypothetical protein